MNAANGHISVATGVGLVLANMIGAGVLLSAGFMAETMGPSEIMFSWVFGLGVALCGTRAYGFVAAVSQKSGGEYRYLTDYIHPFAGFLAGASSLVLGFAAPIAVDAIAIGAYASILGAPWPPRVIAAVVVISLALMHIRGFRTSDRVQNVLVLGKLAAILCFVAVGLTYGARVWPSWEPAAATDGFPVQSFFANQYWIVFAFAGWNAAIYAAAEFRNPIRDVPRAMLIGCTLVGILYLLVNWIFVANMTPEMGRVVFDYETTRITLGHAIMESLIGSQGAIFASALVILAFLAAISAMTFVGPRVYAEMGRDSVLPEFFAGTDGNPPWAATALQTCIALAFLLRADILAAVGVVGGLLMLSSAATCGCVFAIHRQPDLPDASLVERLAAGAYILAMAWCLWLGWSTFGGDVLSVGGVILASALFFAWRRRAAKEQR
jgi:APA family basic amino acid/polyamine antiporter